MSYWATCCFQFPVPWIVLYKKECHVLFEHGCQPPVDSRLDLSENSSLLNIAEFYIENALSPSVDKKRFYQYPLKEVPYFHLLIYWDLSQCRWQIPQHFFSLRSVFLFVSSSPIRLFQLSFSVRFVCPNIQLADLYIRVLGHSRLICHGIYEYLLHKFWILVSNTFSKN